ncbi:hypothetical protein Bbelb_241280 [Branchiostoma belcheri]|nr:hypothetical protein Bbelb_241280 [Branchiostoma belcheri]
MPCSKNITEPIIRSACDLAKCPVPCFVSGYLMLGIEASISDSDAQNVSRRISAPTKQAMLNTPTTPADFLDGTRVGITDIDECYSSPCSNGGTCQNLINEYRCDCQLGWSGFNCQDAESAGPTADAFHDSTAILMDGDIRWLIRRGHRPMMLEWQKPHGDYITTHGDYIITGGVVNPVLY